MTESRLPHWLNRQKLLYSKDRKGSPAQLSELGEAALREKAFTDAFEYFRVAGNRDGLSRLKKIAIEEGDSFLFGALERLGDPFPADEWDRVGTRALELGKLRFARAAFERTKNETMLAKLHDSLAPRPSGPAPV